MPLSTYKPIVLFDGYCNLCSGSVVFVLKRERGDVFRFASLQSDFAERLLTDMGMEKDVSDSIVLVEGGKVYTQSTAALRISKRLRFFWPALYAFVVVPKFIRDPVYDWIARNRYKWFGKSSTCFVPTQDESHKFLDQ
ncbi:MAG: thiol-disulfide oxidoreductase DCC family protein [Bacteroidales bacterium]